MSKRYQKGIAIYLAVVVMSVLLAVGIGTAAILYSQIRMIRSMGDSVIAFYAADTGVEDVLYKDSLPAGLELEVVVPGNLDNTATYEAKKIAPSVTCPGDYYCVKSIGTFKDVRRAIEVSR